MKDPGKRSYTIFNPAVGEAIARSVSRGSTQLQAAAAANCAPGTVTTWLRRGRDERQRREEGIEPNPDWDAFVELVDNVDIARLAGADALIARLDTAGKGVERTTITTRRCAKCGTEEVTTTVTSEPDWRADHALLKSRDTRFRDKLDVEVTYTPEQVTADLVRVLTGLVESEALALTTTQRDVFLVESSQRLLELSPAKEDG